MSVVNDSAFDTGLHCDMGGRAGHSMHACVEYGWECSDVQFTALVLPYQQHVLQIAPRHLLYALTHTVSVTSASGTTFDSTLPVL